MNRREKLALTQIWCSYRMPALLFGSRSGRLPVASWFSRTDFLLAGLKAEQVELARNTMRVHSLSAKAAAACPRCGTVSNHVLSKYRRRPADLSSHDKKVELILSVRRTTYRPHSRLSVRPKKSENHGQTKEKECFVCPSRYSVKTNG